ncbi:hypothetical protein B0J12DRAFT_207651 [Macrophomina phaseolina]|uniref:Uncharacterized protein n=1 Tax=Macrophomina phaseolina TaxID=35725 RepID=A0ABQ8G2S2_9PEZI|nr:hypothetical protein B0J12DRAFT_207651 [Macrophomina phaseolina]
MQVVTLQSRHIISLQILTACSVRRHQNHQQPGRRRRHRRRLPDLHRQHCTRRRAPLLHRHPRRHEGDHGRPENARLDDDPHPFARAHRRRLQEPKLLYRDRGTPQAHLRRRRHPLHRDRRHAAGSAVRPHAQPCGGERQLHRHRQPLLLRAADPQPRAHQQPLQDCRRVRPVRLVCRQA